ncbi:MAG: NUDIX domain-containing protein [bacterium]|nr:NUDIX domain-containing protein [bacterium]
MLDSRPEAIAVKAIIVNDAGRLLMLKRRPNDVHHPGQWDLPGGRLSPQEDPYAGCRREVHEEAGLDGEPTQVLDVHFFTRDDGQAITMLIFLFAAQSADVRLSEEHTEYRWVTPEEAAVLQARWVPRVLERYERWARGGT